MLIEHVGASCTDCHTPHIWIDKGRATCLACHDDKQYLNADEGGCAECHDFRGGRRCLRLQLKTEPADFVSDALRSKI